MCPFPPKYIQTCLASPNFFLKKKSDFSQRDSRRISENLSSNPEIPERHQRPHFPSLGSFPGHSWRSGRGSPGPASPDLCRGGAHRAGPPGDGGRPHRLQPCRVARESAHSGITQWVSLQAGFRDWGAQVKFMGVIWASNSWQSRKTKWSHIDPKKWKAEFSGLELDQYFRASDTGCDALSPQDPLHEPQSSRAQEAWGQARREPPLGSRAPAASGAGPSPTPAPVGGAQGGLLSSYLTGSRRGCSWTSSRGGSGTAHSPTWLPPAAPGFSSCPPLRC